MERRLTSLSDLEGCVAEFRSSHPKGAVVGMYGDLGAGKTTFVRALIRQIVTSGKTVPRVISPSFVLHQSYADLCPPVEHFDLYRLSLADEAALLELGYFETVDRCLTAGGFVCVEWPQHAAEEKLLQLTVKFTIRLETGQLETPSPGDVRVVSWVPA